jgi:hypothetical protein
MGHPSSSALNSSATRVIQSKTVRFPHLPIRLLRALANPRLPKVWIHPSTMNRTLTHPCLQVKGLR